MTFVLSNVFNIDMKGCFRTVVYVYNTINIIQYSTVQYYTTQHNTINTMQHNAMQ